MSKTLIQNGATERITLTALDSSKAGVTGIAANIDIVIRRDSNGDTWTGSAFSASFTTVNPTETDATNLPGRYHYDFTSDTNDITVTVSATTSDSSVDNAPWESGQIEVGGLPGNFEDLKITASTGRVDVGEWLGTAVAAGVGGRPAVDAEGISGSTTAADNVEANITNLNAAISTRSSHTTGDVYLQAAQALQDINLDHLMAAAVTGSEVIDNSALAKLVSASATADWDDFVNTTDSLQALRDRGDSAWATATGFASQASVDTIDTNVDTLITRVPDTVSLANINAQVDTALSDYDGPTKAELDSGLAALNDLSAAEVNAEVDAAIVTYGLDHIVSAAVTGTDITDDSIIAQLVSASATADWDDFDNTTDSLQAIRDNLSGGSADWTSTEREQIRFRLALDGTQTDPTTGTGSIETLLTNLDVAVSTRATQADVATELAGYDGPTNAEMVAAFTEIKGATWSSTTDTLEALRDRGDAAWITATGFAVPGSQMNLVDDAITAAKIAANAIGSSEIADGAITGNKIATDAISVTKVADGTITAAKIAAAAITGTKIASSAIGNSQIAAGAITSGKFAAGAITSTVIAADSIGSSQLATTAVNEIRDAILSDSTPFAGANLNATISSRATAADVSASLVSIGLDHLVSASVAGTDIVDDSIIAKLVSKSATADWDTFVNTTDSLEAIRDNQSAGSGDWSSTEKEQIRFRLALDGTQTDPTTGTGTLEDILADTANIDSNVDVAVSTRMATFSLPTNFADLAITASTGLVDVNNKTGFSIAGTITTLDGLDTALDTVHGAGSWATATGFATAAALASVDSDVAAILTDTSEMQPQMRLAVYGGAIHIDATNGSAGTTEGVNGTPGNPVDTLADAVTLAAATGIRRYKIAGDGTFTLTSAHTNSAFIGSGPGTVIDINGQNVDGSYFENVSYTGTIVGNIDAVNSVAIEVDDFSGHMISGGILGDISIATGQNAYLMETKQLSGSAFFDSDGAKNVSWMGHVGHTTLRNFTTAGVQGADATLDEGQLNLGSEGGSLIVNSSNTSGWLYVSGQASLTRTDAMTGILVLPFNDDSIDTKLSATHTAGSWAGATVADIFNEANMSTTYTTADTAGKLLVDAAAGGGLTAGAIADQVWEEAIADHSGTSGSVAEALANVSAGASPALIADAVWDEATSGHTTAGTTGKAIADIAAIDTAELSSVLSATLDELRKRAAIVVENDVVGDRVYAGDVGVVVSIPLLDGTGALADLAGATDIEMHFQAPGPADTSTQVVAVASSKPGYIEFTTTSSQFDEVGIWFVQGRATLSGGATLWTRRKKIKVNQPIAVP